jgi:hypothetical protein
MNKLKGEKKFPFKKGYDKVPGGMQPELKVELMKGLNIKTRAAWLKRLRGEVEPTVSEAQLIEKIFRKHGITDVWGPGKPIRRKAKQLL